MEPTDHNRRAWDDAHRTSESVARRDALPPGLDELVGGLAGKRVLNLFAGQGDAALELADLGALVTGVDDDESTIAIARSRAPELPWVHADPHALPPQVLLARFDLVFCGPGTLERLRDATAWAAGIASTLGSGASVVLYDDHPVLRCLDRFLHWREDYFAGPTVADVANALAGAGLDVRRLEEAPTRSAWRRVDPRVPATLLVHARAPQE
jgi:SAM-dependent methyltransferase